MNKYNDQSSGAGKGSMNPNACGKTAKAPYDEVASLPDFDPRVAGQFPNPVERVSGGEHG